MVIPKFKVLDFDKYKGTTRSKNHLKMYCRKMGAYAKDEIRAGIFGRLDQMEDRFQSHHADLATLLDGM